MTAGLLFWLALALSSGPSAAGDSATDVDGVRLSALVSDPRLSEISGLAASRRHPGVLWAHNDSGDPAQLFALGEDGKVRATLSLAGVDHIDFEDAAAFELDGRAYLLIADTGDNGGVRRELQLHVLAEPERLADASIAPAWTLRFRWPDGPRDCEAVAVDVAHDEVLLVSKKRVPPELFRLPLHPPADGHVLTAAPVTTLVGIEQPTAEDLQRNPVYGRYRAQISGLDLSPDGHTLAVLNYRRVHLFRRRGDEGWAAALRRVPVVLPFPWLAQAEAIAFSPDGRTLWLSTEHLPAPLLRMEVPE